MASTTERISPSEKRKLRARWSDESLDELNRNLIRSIPKEPAWSLEELRSRIEGRVRVGDEEFVDLRGAKLWGLKNIDWEHVDFSAARFVRGVYAPRLIGTGSLGNIATELRDCRFVSIDADGPQIQGKFTRCDFSHAKLKRAQFWDAALTDCRFVGADISRGKCRTNVEFVRCDFSGAKFRSFHQFGRMLIEDCIFDDADFDHAGIMGTTFRRCSFEGAKLTQIITENVKWEEMEPPEYTEFAMPKNINWRGGSQEEN